MVLGTAVCNATLLKGNHPLDFAVQPELPTPRSKFSKCCNKVSQESGVVLAEASRAIGCINYSFTTGFLLLEELKKKSY